VLRNAITETYGEVDKLLHFTVHKFIRKYGGDYDTLRADANWHFLSAYLSFKPSKSKFSTWVSYRVHMGLLASKRDDKKRAHYLKPLPTKLYARTESTARQLARDLSDDAGAIIRLVLNIIPASFFRRRHNKRQALVEYLTGLGWSEAKIERSFAELREELCTQT
jgi:hypothetical protein